MDLFIAADPGQSYNEVVQYDCDFSQKVVGAATIQSATATHLPPTGSPSNPSVGAIVSGVVPVRLGPLSAEGVHKLVVLATHSDGAKSEMQISIKVKSLPA